ncbi:MAG: zinc dependent phospholipase C family protein [Acidobacteriaceae bacterium]
MDLKPGLLHVLLVPCLILTLALPPPCAAYSVLTHEELIDLAWQDAIRPLLLARFPNTSRAQMVEAHAYAYGGCAIQDMGYYPFGQKLFSDLTHYVRTGDFVLALLRDARNVNEYAFAVGALSHYLGDTIGHSLAINRATAVEFPKLEAKFGPSVTYDESPHAHVRTEYAFDVGQVSKRTFAPPEYLKFVGFEVPRRLLERAFRETYGVEAKEILGKARPALRSYRTAVRTFIPAFTQAEVVLHGAKFPADPDAESYRLFKERLSRVSFERNARWRDTYREPGFKAHLLAIVVFIVPKIGPISILAIKVPSPTTEDWYIRSVNRTVDVFHQQLAQLKDPAQSPLALANLDLDTGLPIKPGDYSLTDQTYATLLHRIVAKPERPIPAGIRDDILHFYSDPDAPNTIKGDGAAWQRISSELQRLRQMKIIATVK